MEIKMDQNKIIIVSGYCATGKSVFSHKLSEVLNILCFNKDTIKETLGDGFGADNNLVFLKGSLATFKIMMYFTEQFLYVNKTCILESNFRNSEIEQIKTLLEKYNSKCLSFLFKGNFDVLYQRYMKRDNIEKRHWVHKSAGETKEIFEEMHKNNGIGETGLGKIIDIDATDFKNINYEELINITKNYLIK